MENSKIEWTNHTFNPWIGCTKVSAGCANCYAETLDKNRFSKTLGAGTRESPVAHWGKGAPRHRTSEAMWREPLKWNREAEKTGKRLRVFCASLADVFDAEVPHQWRADLFDLIRQTPHFDWLLLTKRPENIRPLLGDLLSKQMPVTTSWAGLGESMIGKWLLDGEAPANVWLGTSVEDQAAADKRIPELLKIPAKVRFLSCEPLLGAVDLDFNFFDGQGPAISWLKGRIDKTTGDFEKRSGISWVICGGESGPNARPMKAEWAQMLRDQCQAAGVAFHFKQWGENFPVDQWEYSPELVLTDHQSNSEFAEVGKKAAGRLLDGRTWDELPTP